MAKSLCSNSNTTDGAGSEERQILVKLLNLRGGSHNQGKICQKWGLLAHLLLHQNCVIKNRLDCGFQRCKSHYIRKLLLQQHLKVQGIHEASEMCDYLFRQIIILKSNTTSPRD